MPYLNWRGAALTQTLIPHPKLQSELKLELDAPARDELAARLEETYAQGAGELRLDLPRNWIIFWKLRESDSRLLLAHPQPDEWVATVALEAAFGASLVAAFRALSSGRELIASQLGTLGAMSNVELKLALR
ncbi:MAG: hypothetical protein ACXWPM_13060 [Bdellovibrionota bacterium]